MFMGEISNEFMKASTTSDYLIWEIGDLDNHFLNTNQI